jgi:TolA-binding protein
MTSRETCPKPEELTRLLVNGADEELFSHIEHCEICATEASSFRRMKELGKQLPDGNPGANRADAVLNSLLTSVPQQKRVAVPVRHWVGLAVAASIAVIVGTFIFLDGFSATKKEQSVDVRITRGYVYAQHGAQYMLVGSQPDEIIRLIDGTVSVDVDKLREGERFRVVIGDAEVEVHGTTFDVTAKDDRLVAVRVISGEVEVRPMEAVTATLRPGEIWQKPATGSTTAEGFEQEKEANRIPQDTEKVFGASLSVDKEKRGPVSRRHTSANVTKENQAAPDLEAVKTRRTASVAEISFREGWKALREGRPLIAAEYFDQSVSARDGDPIAEDACFWRAVAHGRAGLNARTAADLKQFLQMYPRSSRAGEACAMLGWKLFERGDYNAAKRLFESALMDTVPRVRASAMQGLSDLKRLSSAP